MVVADDEIDAAGGCILDFVDGLDAAVEYDDELDAVVGRIVDDVARYAVALVVAGGYVEINLGVEILEIAVYERHGSGAVDIVVAVHEYLLFGAHGAVEAVDGLVHVGHEEGVVEVAQRWMEKFLGLGDRCDAALHEQLAYRGDIGITAAQLALEFLLLRGQRQIVPLAGHGCTVFDAGADCCRCTSSCGKGKDMPREPSAKAAYTASFIS